MGNNEPMQIPEEVLQTIYEIFDPSLPRLGPGATTQTYKALDRLLAERDRSGVSAGPLRVLDLGCGNGYQTLDLARRIDGEIVAVDNHQPFVDELSRRAEAVDLDGKVVARVGDMAAPDHPPESCDLIWAEGSIYNVGVTAGLLAWQPLLAENGLVAFTEMSWLKPDPPQECSDFFAEEYPALADVASNLDAITAAGYETIDHFALPADAWWDEFYLPLVGRIDRLQKDWTDEAEKLAVLDRVRMEIDVFHRYSDWYGYVFYLVRPVTG